MTIDRKFLDANCERIILVIVAALIVFAPLAFGAVPIWAFCVIQGMVTLGMIVWGARCWFAPKPRFLLPLICWAVLAFAVLAVGRYLVADIEYAARLEMIQVLVFAGLFFLVVNNLYRQEAVLTMSVVLVTLATGISTYAVIQWITHSNLVWHTYSPYPGRASGTYISPNNLAGFLEMVLPLGVAYSLAGRMGVITRVVLGYAIIMILLGLGVTFSKGGWAGALFGLVVVFVILMTHRKHRWRAVGVFALIIVMVSLFGQRYLAKSDAYKTQFKGVEVGQIQDLDIRLQLWRSAVHMWRDHCWWGVGPGLFDYRFREYRPEIVQNRPDRVHNDYLNLLTDWGVVGGCVVFTGLLLFLWGLVQSWSHVRRTDSDFGSGQSNRFAFYAGAVGGLAALAAHSVVDFNLHIPANAAIGVVLLALLSANVRFATERYWLGPRMLGKMSFSIVLVLIVAYLAAQTTQRIRETRWLMAADKAADPFRPDYIHALEEANKADGKNFSSTHLLGEAYRIQCIQGGQNYAEQAEKAIRWYEAGEKLNPYDGYNYLGSIMCLDQIDRFKDAESLLGIAESLDPNGYYTIAYIGYHYVQVRDNAAARQYLLRSLRLHGVDNEIAQNYLRIVERQMVDKAASTNSLPFDF